jgi:hypothetical protein
MLVFDPLAVCLILCFNHLIKDLPRRKKIEVTPEPTPTPVNIDLPVYSTSAPSTPETESMKSSEIIFGQKQPKPKHPLTPEGEAKRLADILEQQRQEKANRHAKKEQS